MSAKWRSVAHFTSMRSLEFPPASERYVCSLLRSTVVRLMCCPRILHFVGYSLRRKKTPGRRACNVTSLQLFRVVAECEPDRLVIFVWIFRSFSGRLTIVQRRGSNWFRFWFVVVLNDNRKKKKKKSKTIYFSFERFFFHPFFVTLLVPANWIHANICASESFVETLSNRPRKNCRYAYAWGIF